VGTEHTEIFIIRQLHRPHVRGANPGIEQETLEGKNWDLETGVPIRTCEQVKLRIPKARSCNYRRQEALRD